MADHAGQRLPSTSWSLARTPAKQRMRLCKVQILDGLRWNLGDYRLDLRRRQPKRRRVPASNRSSARTATSPRTHIVEDRAHRLADTQIRFKEFGVGFAGFENGCHW
ncbi:MAG: hypothetical protein R2856_34030 [Caldilineaceae bacterium]